jgi:cysteine desulfurase
MRRSSARASATPPPCTAGDARRAPRSTRPASASPTASAPQQDEICFTSGGTEGDNLAVLGTMARPARAPTGGRHLAHRAQGRAAGGAPGGPSEGGRGALLEVTPTARGSRARAPKPCGRHRGGVSVMWVNNEIGVHAAHRRAGGAGQGRAARCSTPTRCRPSARSPSTRADPVRLRRTISGHKIGAPKGIGAMFIRRGTPLEPLMYGGSQERVDGARARRTWPTRWDWPPPMELAVAERDRTSGPSSRRCATRSRPPPRPRIPDAVIHGRGAPRAPHILNISVPGTDSESLLMALDLQGHRLLSGSACQRGASRHRTCWRPWGCAPTWGAPRSGCRSARSRRRRGRARGRALPALVEKARRTTAQGA